MNLQATTLFAAMGLQQRPLHSQAPQLQGKAPQWQLQLGRLQGCHRTVLRASLLDFGELLQLVLVRPLA